MSNLATKSENMAWTEILTIIIGSGLATGVLALLGNAMGWVRFSKKDKAEISKVESETKLDLAEVVNKKIDDEVKISKAALEWTVQLALQLEKANLVNDKRQQEIDRLHTVMNEMRLDFEIRKVEFEKRMDDMEKLIQINQADLLHERTKNTELIEKLNSYINGGKKP